MANGYQHGGMAEALRFGAYELDLRALELRKGGSLLRLKPQPFRVLALLAESAGNMVSRDELRERIWGSETFVDFERGLNSCITQIRAVLNDDAEAPRYIETLPRRGYRFLAPVERVVGTAAPAFAPEAPAGQRQSDLPATMPVPAAREVPRSGALAMALGLAALVLLVAAVTFFPSPNSGVAPPPAESQRIMLAVLPFKNLSGDPQQEFFGDGMTEEMIAVLGGLQPTRLGVIARTSAMRYKSDDKSVREISKELNVGYVVEGSIRREGDRARITAQLIRASDETHLWAENYERSMRDLIGVQRDVAQKIARALAIELLPSALAALAEKSSVDPAAYEHYLRGRFWWNRMSGPAFERAVEQYERALKIDPKYAPAHAGLADAYNLQPWWGVAPPREALERARTAANKALELEPNLADAHNSLGFVQLYLDWNLPAAERSFKRAIELRPGFALAHYWYAGMLSAAARHDEAIASIRRAQELDPYSEMVNSDAGWYYFFARRYDEAIEQCRRTLAMKPNFSWTYLCIYEAQVQKGERAGAVETQKKMLALAGVSEAEIAKVLIGPPADALNSLRRFWLSREIQSRANYLSYYQAATTLAALGDVDGAVAALERTLRDRDSGVVNLRVDPRMDPLRQNPRFATLLRDTRL